MRAAVEACLFDGNQVRTDCELAENFWKGLSSMGSPEAWIFHWDVLHENKIITTQELQQLLKTILCPQGEMAEKGLKNFQTYWGKGEEDFVKKKIFLSKVIEIIEKNGGFDLALWKNFDMSVLKKSVGQNQSWVDGRLGEFIPQLELQIERSMLEKATSNIPAYKSTKAPFKI